jgi:hypothetical protein
MGDSATECQQNAGPERLPPSRMVFDHSMLHGLGLR